MTLVMSEYIIKKYSWYKRSYRDRNLINFLSTEWIFN